MKYDTILGTVIAFCFGALVTLGIYVSSHRHYYEVIKVTAGEFIIHDGKMYAVYEMERNVRGEIQAGAR
jgi:hypothetical protein